MRPMRSTTGDISTRAARALRGALGLAATLAAAAIGPISVLAQGAAPATREMVLSFDDVPVVATCAPDAIRQITARLTDVLERRGIPSAALVTPIECVNPTLLRETLRRWREVGATIGNHSHTHPDLNGTPTEAYFDGIQRAQERIDEAVPTGGRWFRPPYLHTGNDRAKKEALAAYLADEGYRMAPVTVDNQEWVYAGVYDAAVEAGDAALAERALDGYLRHLEESVVFYEDLSRAVFGREIPQVLLLHANQLNADHLDAVIDLLEARGYGFISLETATQDPAYASEDPYVGPRGLSWLQRWALAKGVDVPAEPREEAWASVALARAREGADEPGDEEAVRRALEHYLAGHATGRGAHFDSVFHSSANLYWVANGELRSRTSAEYIAGASGAPAADEAERERRIAWVEVKDDIAIARIELEYPSATFTDYMSLLRVDGEWRIVAKLFDIDRP